MTFKRFLQSEIFRQLKEERRLKREHLLKEQPTAKVEDHVSQN